MIHARESPRPTDRSNAVTNDEMPAFDVNVNPETEERHDALAGDNGFEFEG
jgi:hypothetical protein